MKKKSLVLLSFLLFGSLTSCDEDTSTNASSQVTSESKGYQVAKSKFNTYANLTQFDNVQLKIEMEGSARTSSEVVKLDGNKLQTSITYIEKEDKSSSTTNTYYTLEDGKYYAYIEAPGKTGHCSKNVIEEKKYTKVVNLYFDFTEGYGAEYDKFTYNADTHSYTAESLSGAKNVVASFENEKLVKITADVIGKDASGNEVSTPAVIDVTYENQSVDLPQELDKNEVDMMKYDQIFNLTTQTDLKVELTKTSSDSTKSEKEVRKIKDNKIIGPMAGGHNILVENSSDEKRIAYYKDNSGNLQSAEESGTYNSYLMYKLEWFYFSYYALSLDYMEYKQEEKQYYGQNVVIVDQVEIKSNITTITASHIAKEVTMKFEDQKLLSMKIVTVSDSNVETTETYTFTYGGQSVSVADLY